MAVLNSSVPTAVLASNGVKLKYVLGEITVTSKYFHEEKFKNSRKMTGGGSPQRFLSIPRRTVYPPHPEPNITMRCLLRADVQLKSRFWRTRLHIFKLRGKAELCRG
jgi:hypothetical protein